MDRLRIAAGVGAWLMVAVIIALVTGLPRWRSAWLGMGVLFVVIPTQLAWQLTPRGARARVPVSAAMVAGLGAGLLVTAIAPLSVAELRAVERRFVLPDTWVQTTETQSGGPLCLQSCPTVTWQWDVDDQPSAAVVDTVAVLRSAGFRVVVAEEGGRAVLQATSGRVRAEAVVGPRPGAGGEQPAAAVRMTLATRR